jgi:hypothetical protein
VCGTQRLAAMVIALPSTTVNPRFRNAGSQPMAGLFDKSEKFARCGVQIPFIAILKLLFKFDRS